MLTLGARIRSIRQQRRQTLEALARQTGLTASFLSQVEREVVSPSVASLQKMAQALGTTVGTFFDEAPQKGLTVIRQTQRQRVVDRQTRSAVERLASGLMDLRMEPRLLVLAARGRVGPPATRHGGEAFGMVLEGAVELHRGKEEAIRIQKGDSVYVRDPRPLTMRNTTSRMATVLWITFAAA